MTIATDRVDKELDDRPRRMAIKFIRNFMVVFGLLSSVFDYFTFGALLLILKTNPTQFRTGWFLESIISASLIVLVAHTRRWVFESKPGKYLFIATIVTVQSWLRKSSTNIFNLNSVSDVIELAIGEALPLTHIITHLEPLEDPLSLDDRNLDRIITTHRLSDK